MINGKPIDPGADVGPNGQPQDPQKSRSKEDENQSGRQTLTEQDEKTSHDQSDTKPTASRTPAIPSATAPSTVPTKTKSVTSSMPTTRSTHTVTTSVSPGSKPQSMNTTILSQTSSLSIDFTNLTVDVEFDFDMEAAKRATMAVVPILQEFQDSTFQKGPLWLPSNSEESQAASAATAAISQLADPNVPFMENITHVSAIPSSLIALQAFQIHKGNPSVSPSSSRPDNLDQITSPPTSSSATSHHHSTHSPVKSSRAPASRVPTPPPPKTSNYLLGYLLSCTSTCFQTDQFFRFPTKVSDWPEFCEPEPDGLIASNPPQRSSKDHEDVTLTFSDADFAMTCTVTPASNAKSGSGRASMECEVDLLESREEGGSKSPKAGDCVPPEAWSANIKKMVCPTLPQQHVPVSRSWIPLWAYQAWIEL